MRSPKPKTGNPAIAVGYIRVSKTSQELSPEAQREALARWCVANGATLAAVHVDAGVSSVTPFDMRTGFLAVLRDIEGHGAGVLLVWKRDRIARDVLLAAMATRLAERVGAHVVSTAGEGNGNSPEAEMMRGIVDVFAQYERAMIRARTCAALAVKKARGERTGTVPYGFRLAADGIRLEGAPLERENIARVHLWRDDGRSLRAITAMARSAGMRSRTGRPVALTQIASMARRKSDR